MDTLTINYDEDAESPWEWNDILSFISFHRRIDNQNQQEDILDSSNFNSIEEAEDYLTKNGYIHIPMYLYDHSGWSVKSTPFGCTWDSGQAGALYISKKQVIKDWGKKNLTQKVKDSAIQYMEGFIEALDQYYTGEVYYFTVKDEHNNILDSCRNFYDKDSINEYLEKDISEYNIIDKT